MKKYLIRFNETEITQVIEASPNARMLGIVNDHMVCGLTEAKDFFNGTGKNIQVLLDKIEQENNQETFNP